MNVEETKKQFEEDLKNAKDKQALFALKVKYLGRKQGLITLLMKELAEMGVEDKRRWGPKLNELKQKAEREFETGDSAKKEILEFDHTLPGLKPEIGSLHPVTQTQWELEDFFLSMGFKVLYGPEVESDYFNFEALNIPSWHPAREMQDTIWTEKEGILMRTHTSPMQVRAMLKYGAPLRCVVPGKVFRYEATDARHEHTFYQLEGLMIDENISVGNMIAFLRLLVEKLIGQETKVRIRPGYFPFVEPGIELDAECLICRGKGCGLCKGTGWVEVLPAGMVHPNVLEFGEIDPKKYSGFAFGAGLSRLAQLKFGYEDTRMIHQNDLRFLRQF